MSVTILQDTATPRLAALADALRPGRHLSLGVTLPAGAFLPSRPRTPSAFARSRLRASSVSPSSGLPAASTLPFSSDLLTSGILPALLA